MESRAADDGFRRFDATTHPDTAAFYREHHARQTYAFAREQQERFLPLRGARMSVWRAIERLDEIVDQSDPDVSSSQHVHALQTAEALRSADQPRWLILTGFVHDLGKVLCLFGEPQWAVVGDSYAVGCAFPASIVHSEYLAANPDRDAPAFASPTGIYPPGCGLDQVHFSWGHDEYLYQVLRAHLPGEALNIIRYHSCYPWHRDGAYRELMNADDGEAQRWVQLFNRYDLYSKSEAPPDWQALEPYYRQLVAEFLPDTLQW